MEITAIKNKLITYLTYGKIPKNVMVEIQEALLRKRDPKDFIQLLEKVETNYEYPGN